MAIAPLLSYTWLISTRSFFPFYYFFFCFSIHCPFFSFKQKSTASPNFNQFFLFFFSLFSLLFRAKTRRPGLSGSFQFRLCLHCSPSPSLTAASSCHALSGPAAYFCYMCPVPAVTWFYLKVVSPSRACSFTPVVSVHLSLLNAVVCLCKRYVCSYLLLWR